jgi:hypothetical protein
VTLAPVARLVVALGAVLLPLDLAASKPQPIVVGRWEGVPATVRLGQTFTLTLRLVASRDAADVTVELLPSRGIEVTKGDRLWTGSLAARTPHQRSFAARVIAEGRSTLGARITNRENDGEQVSGVVLSVIARNGVATLITDPAKAWGDLTPEERARLGVTVEAPPSLPAKPPEPRRKSPSSR